MKIGPITFSINNICNSLQIVAKFAPILCVGVSYLGASMASAWPVPIPTLPQNPKCGYLLDTEFLHWSANGALIPDPHNPNIIHDENGICYIVTYFSDAFRGIVYELCKIDPTTTISSTLAYTTTTLGSHDNEGGFIGLIKNNYKYLVEDGSIAWW
jgi:hypothetical protein